MLIVSEAMIGPVPQELLRVFAYTEPSLIVAGEEPGVALGQKPVGAGEHPRD